MRWLVALVLVCGCAKSLDELYPFRCPQDNTTCPIGGDHITCSDDVGCTRTCFTSVDCTDADGNARVDLACIPVGGGISVCEQSCTDENGHQDSSRCADNYACTSTGGLPGNAAFTCLLLTTTP